MPVENGFTVDITRFVIIKDSTTLSMTRKAKIK